MQSRASHQQVPITYEHRSAAVPQPRARLSRVSAQRASLGTESDAIPHAGGVFVNHNAKLGQGSPLTATRSGADLSILTFGAKHPLSSTYQRMQDNRALCALLQRGDADGFGASEGSSTNSEDDKGLFREDDEDSTWTEAEEVEEGEEDTVPATAHTTAAILSERPHAAVAEAQSQMIRAFAGLLPLLPAFGSQASNYFSSTEQARISDFLQLMQAELGSS